MCPPNVRLSVTITSGGDTQTTIVYLTTVVLSRFYFPSLPIFETESLTGGMHKAKRDHEQPKEKYYGGDIGLEPLFWTRFSP